MTPLRLTVAICTWNRHALLRQTLEQMTRLVVPPDVAWELIVVNNNSTDATDAVLAEFAGRLPLRRVFEPTPGKSNALNRAAREAAGDYILWTDDDALVEPDWVEAYVRAFRRWPKCALFGGYVAPWFEGTPPSWLEPLIRAEYRVSCVYALRTLGDRPLPISTEALPGDASTLPFGVNLAVRRQEQLHFPYDPALGLRPGSQIRGEETAMILKMLEAGHTGWWLPDARVRHFIPRSRQSVPYLRDWFHGDGEEKGKKMRDANYPKLFGRPRWLVRIAVEAELRYLIRRLQTRPEHWIRDLINASVAWGQLRGFMLRGELGERAPAPETERLAKEAAS